MSKKVLYVRVEPGIKQRVQIQCDRLGISENALITMALVKLLEEEEKEQSSHEARGNHVNH